MLTGWPCSVSPQGAILTTMLATRNFSGETFFSREDTVFQCHPRSAESPFLPHQPSAPFLQAGEGPASVPTSKIRCPEGLLASLTG